MASVPCGQCVGSNRIGEWCQDGKARCQWTKQQTCCTGPQQYLMLSLPFDRLVSDVPGMCCASPSPDLQACRLCSLQSHHCVDEGTATLHLLLSCLLQVGSIFEYLDGNAIFGVVPPDSPLWAPILGFFAFTGIPMAGGYHTGDSIHKHARVCTWLKYAET